MAKNKSPRTVKLLKLRITKRAAANCDSYVNYLSCLAATAARYQFPGATISCGPGSLTIQGQRYIFTPADARRIENAYVNDLSGSAIRPGFKPFVVTLTPV